MVLCTEYDHMILLCGSYARVPLHDCHNDSRTVQHVFFLTGLFWIIFDITSGVYIIQSHDKSSPFSSEYSFLYVFQGFVFKVFTQVFRFKDLCLQYVFIICMSTEGQNGAQIFCFALKTELCKCHLEDELVGLLHENTMSSVNNVDTHCSTDSFDQQFDLLWSCFGQQIQSVLSEW